MDFLNKLDALMAVHGLNKHTLSIQCGVPYTTIDAWYKKGYNNAKLSTIQKLADFFGTTLDYLMRDEITDVDYGAMKKSPEPTTTDPEDEKEKDEIVKILTEGLSRLGFLDEEGMISDRDFRFLCTLVDLISDHFEKD